MEIPHILTYIRVRSEHTQKKWEREKSTRKSFENKEIHKSFSNKFEVKVLKLLEVSYVLLHRFN